MVRDTLFLAQQLTLVAETTFELNRLTGVHSPEEADHIARRCGFRPRKPPKHTGAGPNETAGARAARHDRKNGTIPALAFRLHTRIA